MQSQSRNGLARGGFTLIEIMAVLAIIAILTSIAVVVAGKVTQSGRIQATQDIIRVLDTVLDSYVAEREASVPSVLWDDTTTGTGPRPFPLWDGRAVGSSVDGDASLAEPSLALFLLIAREVPSVETTLAQIDSKFIRLYHDINRLDNPPSRPDPRIYVAGRTDPVRKLGNRSVIEPPAYPEYAQYFSINDAWGRPIRFVHPAWQGGGGDYWNGSGLVGGRPTWLERDVDGDGAIGVDERIRRSYRPFNLTAPGVARAVGDADEGICLGNRPYFYSAGADGDPGTRGDNVYTKKPTYPTETKDF